MSLKEALFKLSRKGGFGFAGNAAYSLCTRLVSLYFRMTPEIRSAYLAGSMSSGDIVPGLSDIDFVVTAKDMQSQDAFNFYADLEGILRYILPPYGEDKIGSHVTCYSVSEWQLLGDIFLNKRCGAPLTAFEKDDIELKYRFGNSIKSLHHFYKAHWRLEMIEQGIVNPPKNEYEFLLRERLLERCFRSIQDGIDEAGIKTVVGSRATDLGNEIKNLISKSTILGKDDLHTVILSRLLHFYDLASAVIDSEMGHSHENFDIGGYLLKPAANAYEDIEMKSMFNEVSFLLKDETANSPIFCWPKNKIDYFLYDLSRYSVTERIIGLYRSRNSRRFSILSKSRIDNNYFVFRENEPPFISLGDNKRYVLNMKPDRERVILEAYTIFPQLRTPANVRNPAKYQAFLEKAGRLIGVIDSLTPPKCLRTDTIKDPAPDRECSLRGGSEHERFEILNEVSSVLRDRLTAFLESTYETSYVART